MPHAEHLILVPAFRHRLKILSQKDAEYASKHMVTSQRRIFNGLSVELHLPLWEIVADGTSRCPVFEKTLIEPA